MLKEKKFKILFTGGGTGGHTVPIIAIARELKNILEDRVSFYYLGPVDSLTKQFLSEEEIKMFSIPAGKIRRYVNFQSIILNFIDIFKTLIGFFISFFYLFVVYPDIIFSKGGFGSFPVILSSFILRIPVFLHESDAVPGLANRICAKFSKKIFVSFENTPYFPQDKTIFVGNPIRKELLNFEKGEAMKRLKITGEKPVILVLGGSQGAQRINEKILQVSNELLENFEVIHQIGSTNFKKIQTMANVLIRPELKVYYHPFSFLQEEELGMAYTVADLVVARAGAGTIFEIMAFGKPSILIPLPESAQNHQKENAYYFAKKGAAIVIEEQNFTPGLFVELLRNLIKNKEKLKTMGSIAKSLARPEVAKQIATEIVVYLTK